MGLMSRIPFRKVIRLIEKELPLLPQPDKNGDHQTFLIMFYTAAWCTSDESTFRKELPFELLGESIKRYHSTLPLHIVLLEGIELLSSGYIRMLEAMGFIVIDYTAGFRKIVADYPNLDATHSRYQRNCLLRWASPSGNCSKGIRTSRLSSGIWTAISCCILRSMNWPEILQARRLCCRAAPFC